MKYWKSYDSDTAFKKYKDLFVKGSFGISKGYAVQNIGKEWFTSNYTISDSTIWDHLKGKYWVATLSQHFPKFAFFDIDGTNSIDEVHLIMKSYGLSESQYNTYSSPSYEKSGNVHVLFKPVYKKDPLSINLLHTILGPKLKNNIKFGIELFPNGNRKFRLPFGYKQNFLDPNTGSPTNMPLKENIYWLDKIDEFELHVPIENKIVNMGYKYIRVKNRKSSNFTQEIEHLLTIGLKTCGTRYHTTQDLAKYCRLKGVDKEGARCMILNFLSDKHNGKSKEINKGNWKQVEIDINNSLNFYYGKYDPSYFTK